MKVGTVTIGSVIGFNLSFQSYRHITWYAEMLYYVGYNFNPVGDGIETLGVRVTGFNGNCN